MKFHHMNMTNACVSTGKLCTNRELQGDTNHRVDTIVTDLHSGRVLRPDEGVTGCACRGGDWHGSMIRCVFVIGIVHTIRMLSSHSSER